MAELEEDAIAEIERLAGDAETEAQIQRAVDKPPSADDAHFLGAKVRKVFTDGALTGTVERHVVLPMPDEPGADEGAAGERWLVQYSNGKQELVRPHELLDILMGDGATAKPKQAQGPKLSAHERKYLGLVLETDQDGGDEGEVVKVNKKTVWVKWSKPVDHDESGAPNYMLKHDIDVGMKALAKEREEAKKNCPSE